MRENAGMVTWQGIWGHIGISPSAAVGVVIATFVVYLFMAAVLRLAGPRLWSNPSVFSFALVTLLGSLCARAMLGNAPTMSAALIAVVVLLVLEAALGRLRSPFHRHRSSGARRPVVVMAGGVMVESALRRRRLSQAQLLSRLRVAGVTRLDEVALVILETRGGLTIIRRGDSIDARLVEGVVGIDDVPAGVIAP